LNERGYDHARQLIEDGRYVLDERDEWSGHQPASRQENDRFREVPEDFRHFTAGDMV
jgi:hypothetical protein